MLSSSSICILAILDNKTREIIRSELARLLRAEREKRELSLGSVAEKAGLSYQMVSYVEREMRTPTIDTLLRITEALEIDLVDVLQRAQRLALAKKK